MFDKGHTCLKENVPISEYIPLHYSWKENKRLFFTTKSPKGKLVYIKDFLSNFYLAAKTTFKWIKEETAFKYVSFTTTSKNCFFFVSLFISKYFLLLTFPLTFLFYIEHTFLKFVTQPLFRYYLTWVTVLLLCFRSSHTSLLIQCPPLKWITDNSISRLL